MPRSEESKRNLKLEQTKNRVIRLTAELARAREDVKVLTEQIKLSKKK